MKPSFKIRTALRLADRLGTRARELRRDLRDHVRNESFRIQEAEKRARGLRLYAAWSRSHQPRQPMNWPQLGILLRARPETVTHLSFIHRSPLR